MELIGSILENTQADRPQDVKEFNVRTLRTLNYYFGYVSVETLTLIFGYTIAGVRNRMNALAKQGWVRKLDFSEGLGRSEQIWYITSAGRRAAQTENQPFLESSDEQGFSVSEYAPALTNHTMMVQIIASRLTHQLECSDVRPFRFEHSGKTKNDQLIPDIILDKGVLDLNGNCATVYDLYEVELTLKPFTHYQAYIESVANQNWKSEEAKSGYSIGMVFFVVPSKLYSSFEAILRRIERGIGISLITIESVLTGSLSSEVNDCSGVSTLSADTSVSINEMGVKL